MAQRNAVTETNRRLEWAEHQQNRGHRPCCVFSRPLRIATRQLSDISPTTMARKKLSDCTAQETNTFLRMIEVFKRTLNEENEDDKMIISSLVRAAAKFVELQVSSTPRFPDDFWQLTVCN